MTDFQVIDAIDDTFLALNSAKEDISNAVGRAWTLKRAGLDTADLDEKLQALTAAVTDALAAHGRVREERLRKPEPPDGTVLIGDLGGGTVPAALFRRHDHDGSLDRWWDYNACEWINWPEAMRRGANPGRRLTEETHGG